SSRIAGMDVEAVYTKMPDKPSADQLRPILNSVVDGFAEGRLDAVDVIFTKFVSSVNAQVQQQRLLPAGFEEAELDEEMAHADVEPSPAALLRAASLRLLEAQIYQAFLESVAS